MNLELSALVVHAHAKYNGTPNKVTFKCPVGDEEHEAHAVRFGKTTAVGCRKGHPVADILKPWPRLNGSSSSAAAVNGNDHAANSAEPKPQPSPNQVGRNGNHTKRNGV